jgi:PAS domain S-box-containing protein
VALVALKVGNNRLGLLQLNDKRKGMFTLDSIQMWERIADHLALALSRTLAEEALRKSEARYRTLFSSIDEAFALHEMLFDNRGVPNDYRFLEVNEAFERQTGLRASQIIGKTVCEVFPDLEPFWLETYGKVVMTGEPVRFENYNQSTNRYYEVYAFRPVQGRFAALFNDITERKQLQQRLEEYAKNLEKIVEERTKQLKDSERLSAIGATAGMVGHDIRNPLQAITGDVYLTKTELADLPESEAKQAIVENLEAIEQNIVYIDKIVADLQDFVRPLKPAVKQVDIKKIIKSLLQSNVPKNIQTTYYVQSEASNIVVDSDLLKRILSNLIINSIQAMPQGGRLSVKAYKDVNHVVISIEDTGVGIPEEVKGKLFTPMFTTKAKGQGFGLAVVKRLTEALGGTISFESQEGKGTKFIVKLPA